MNLEMRKIYMNLDINCLLKVDHASPSDCETFGFFYVSIRC